MSRTDSRRSTSSAGGRGWSVGLPVVTLVAAVILGWFLWNRAAPPPLDADPDVQATIDALFTAVTSRREPLLADCEQRLRSQREAGKLSAASDEYLTAVIAQARGGQWEPAARKLYEYVQPQ